MQIILQENTKKKLDIPFALYKYKDHDLFVGNLYFLS